MADIFRASFDGLVAVFLFPAVIYMLIGSAFGFFLGVIPGVGGVLGMALVLPLVFALDAGSALALLVAIYAVSSQGGSITSILLGVPGTGINVATVFDGYPMARRGEGGRAISISMTASALGGLFGALVLALLIPVLRPIVLAFAPPEFFLLALWGIVFIAFVDTSNMLKALLTGGLGLMLSFVGQEPNTGTLRYTFGQLYLWDGIALVPAVIGLFAVTEMLDLAVRGGSIAGKLTAVGGGRLQGVRDVFTHWWLFLRSSVIGVVVGVIPGLGGTVSNFLAYGQAVQSAKDPSRFGTGIPEGIIAPEAATNAKEGGSLVPTLAFGIPGSESMALLLGAFLILGLQPGSEMLTLHLDLVFMMVWLLVVSNLVGAIAGVGLAGQLALITRVPGGILVPIVFVISFLGSYATNFSLGDIIIAVVFGIAGYYLKKHNFSRATLIIGLVLGEIVEADLLLAAQAYGTRMFTRPLTLILLLVIILTLVLPLLQQRKRAREGGRLPSR